ncbi:MAG: NAD(P)-dependent glycerol-3-phosphate dehydrogenase [Alphaproteobacteria bacterium]|jgi:glycerol-3-phosphate dehydrogenase (NAD(P)+)|nr:NAD(P)-dependent glycerol-3-phosphate dehydrogenase [Alphaproteobacteria bacterium]MCB9985351.1 NAD(P)-dependent glycerol-3-phosphate dehydrogenase [Micavibrio sp.]HRK98131.1 NAD(P)H-dependent glycerol-3-phosphate dehydrogenase [Alphaproteobacteria bacterium]
MTKIAIIGAGAWGTALAQCYATAGHDVDLWTRLQDHADEMIEQGRNDRYLPDIDLHNNINISTDLTEITQAELILNVTPAQYLRDSLRQLAPFLRDNQPIVICAKGIEIESHSLLSTVAHEECPKAKIAILTGPNFAIDIARGLPSASTLASDPETGKFLMENLTARNLRLYFTSDMVSAQIGGAIKNVIAIACGICHGLNLGESARAALVTRGLAEIARLSESLGGKRDTLMGQCGVGDIMLTCSSIQSRNFSCGVALAQGKTIDEILNERTSVTEGVPTAKAAQALATANNIDMPITQAIYQCLYENLPITAALDQILNRPARHERE